jgi:hypothetical protein
MYRTLFSRPYSFLLSWGRLIVLPEWAMFLVGLGYPPQLFKCIRSLNRLPLILLNQIKTTLVHLDQINYLEPASCMACDLCHDPGAPVSISLVPWFRFPAAQLSCCYAILQIGWLTWTALDAEMSFAMPMWHLQSGVIECLQFPSLIETYEF